MYGKIFTVLTFAIFFSFTVFAQYPNVQVNNPSSTDPEEVTIAVNPVNTNILAGGANINYSYRTTNGGSSWLQSYMNSTLGQVWGDPCVTFDSLGNLYYGHLSNGNYFIDRIVIQKSTDNGITWNDGAGIGFNDPKQQDKEWIAADMTNSPYRNNVYVSWTEFDSYGSSNSSDSSRILFSRSVDHGITWSQPIIVSDRSGDCLDSDNTDEGAVPAVGPDGQIYISWAGPLGLMFDKSLDGGQTFGVDKHITDIPGGWDFDVSGISRCNGLPITACDISNSPYRGNIYVNWSDQRNGATNTDIFIVKSTDGGNTWTQPLKVNDDNTDRQQFFTWMTVDPKTGVIYVVFYDRRNTTGAATDVYMARSTDGGDTFQNFKVSESSFTPQSFVFFGDYINVSAFDKNVHPIWMRLDNSTLSVWTTSFYDSLAGTPVELTNFVSEIRNDDVILNWQTSTETNNQGFEVQRMKETNEPKNENWRTINFVKGNGTSTEEHNYSYTDKPAESGLYKYRLKQIDYNGNYKYSNIIEVNYLSIESFKLEQNYPNPFNPSTTIGYELPKASYVTLKVYDMLGNEVKTLVNGNEKAGVHEVIFNASELASGVYMYKFNSGNFTTMKKMILLK